jgi:hypothetical protein
MNRWYLCVPILASVLAVSCGGIDPTMDGTIEDDEVVGEATATVNAADKVLCHIKKERSGFRGRVRFYGAHRTADGWRKISLGHVSCSLFTRNCGGKVKEAIREIVREGYVPVVDTEGQDKCNNPFG